MSVNVVEIEENLRDQIRLSVASNGIAFIKASSKKGHPGREVMEAINWLVCLREFSPENKKPTEEERQMIIEVRKEYLTYPAGCCWRKQIARAAAWVGYLQEGK